MSDHPTIRFKNKRAGAYQIHLHPSPEYDRALEIWMTDSILRKTLELTLGQMVFANLRYLHDDGMHEGHSDGLKHKGITFLADRKRLL